MNSANVDTLRGQKPRHGVETLDLGNTPAAPRSIEDTGLNFLFLVDLLLKIMFFGGQLKLKDLSRRCKLPASVIDSLLGFMRAEHLCEVPRRGEADVDIAYALTELGRLRAEDALKKSQYVGPAPVSHASYVAQVEAQSVHRMGITREVLAQAFEGVVVHASTLHIFGAALNSGRAIFVHGPSGGGKTFIAEKLVGVLRGHVYVPHAILVDSEVIQILDPLVHRPVENAPTKVVTLDRMEAHDTRWVLCHRPVVLTGGELTLGMLDLDFDRTTRFYNAPPQVKANNGLFVVDDLGRQLVPARDLMNRWIVPLDRRIDYLALHTGTKFPLPFDVIVIFSSNLRPGDLADDAFMRRLGYKIYVGPLDQAQYGEVVRQACKHYGVFFSDASLEFLIHECHEREARPLLACIPWDIIGQVRDRAVYEGAEPAMTPETLRWAWANYFSPAHEGEKGENDDNSNPTKSARAPY